MKGVAGVTLLPLFFTGLVLLPAWGIMQRNAGQYQQFPLQATAEQNSYNSGIPNDAWNLLTRLRMGENAQIAQKCAQKKECCEKWNKKRNFFTRYAQGRVTKSYTKKNYVTRQRAGAKSLDFSGKAELIYTITRAEKNHTKCTKMHTKKRRTKRHTFS